MRSTFLSTREALPKHEKGFERKTFNIKDM